MNWRALLIIAVAIFLTLLFLNQLSLPYLWIWLMWLGLAVLGVRRAQSTNLRAFYVNAAVVVAFLLCLEVFALVRDHPAQTSDRNYDRGYRTSHPYLGYAPNPGVAAGSSLVVDDTTIYDVKYTINATGQRIGPLPPQPGKACILFFGGSFTFGEGVEDNETLPWRAGELTGIPTINFGFHGYGPHQMLSAIENGLVDEAAADCRPVAAVYSTVIEHVFRSAGKAFWDTDGPRYVADGSGLARHTGTFADYATGLDRAIHKVRSKLDLSAAYRRFIGSYSRYQDDDIAIYLAVIATAQERLRAKYPGIEFSVLFWDQHRNEVSTGLQAGIEAIPARLFKVTDAIPDLSENWGIYTLAYDGHPTALANEKLANFVVREVLAEPASETAERQRQSELPE